ncbi:MAG: ABC transporter substrate-binding protein [Bacillati bacterium ANGP1]|uniref:ABC transporter substrate-binding protein n=1 Tax=Candidatus Segetimicrobium genomatis TaxID=2569760 RepID=A0A537K5M2_9BACT|nr:MAG: ABC transporter substrate-binding protein [Terrabacteria group bacterium ANGP1]
MVTQARLSRGAVLALATIGCLAAGLLFSPAARVGWAAQMNDTFVWGKSGDADTLDNQVSSNGETSEVTTQVYNLLVRAKQGQTDIEPDLAESWSVSPDGLVWTFKLRKGVTFHDGTPWNAEAAKFNFDRMADPKNPYHAVKGFDFEYWNDFMADSFKEARVVDPYTLQVVLNKPNAPLVYNLSIISFDMASPASFQKYGGEGVGQHPVGTGPYKFVEWIRDDHITLEANPSFFRKGLPKTRRIVMRVIKDNAARFLALRANEVHAMELPNTDDVKVAQNDPTLKVGFRPPFNTGWVRFNMNNDLFKDKRIRQAVAIAINRPAIVQGLYAGFGEVAQQHMPPLMWGRAQTGMGYDYNPAKARQLLAEAKYPNGFSLDFWYIPVSRPYFPAGKEIGTAIASDLGRIGIRVHLMTEDWAAYLKDRKTNKFPIFMIGWIGDNGDPDDWMGFFFPKYDPGNAYLSYNNPAVFDAINKGKVAVSQAERAKLYAQAEQMILSDYRDIPIAHAKVPLLMRKNVEGLVGQPDANEYMETVELK